jgi:hypothetical protein
MKRFAKDTFLVLAVLTCAAVQALAQGTPVYDNIPNPLPPNVPSEGFQATQTAEFGDNVFLGGTHRRAYSVVVTMSDWAKHSDYPILPAAGYTHPITLNIYTVNTSGPNPALGSLIGSVTQNFLIPWRPESDPLCTGDRWKAADNLCYSGLAFKVTFDLRSLALTLPNNLIYGVAFNTQTWGAHPIGLPGPYNSLNVGLATATPPTVGIDVESDALFWNTATASNYTDGGAGGVGIFRRDDNWTPFSPAVQINAYTVAANKDQCKGNGWQRLSRADGSVFKNQGDCIQYSNTGK